VNHSDGREQSAVATWLDSYVDVQSLTQDLHQFYELIKPRIALLIVISTSVGYSYGVGQHFNLVTFFNALLGTALMAAGSATLNQWYERDIDALMDRTKMRPIPAGTITPGHALAFGVAASVLGFLELLAFVNVLAAGLGLLTSVGYLFAYTPLKRRGPICTTIGAFPGAMPPLIGYAAASGHLSVQAWVLFAILFLWQFPHFHAIAWLYREEYEKVGIKMLAVVKPTGSALNVEIMTALLLLIPATLAPTFLQMAGNVYLVAAILLNLAFLYFGVQMSRQHDRPRARKLLLASVIYVPLLFAFLVVDNPRFTSLF
jgi:protoheme IX farnesyltransferase